MKTKMVGIIVAIALVCFLPVLGEANDGGYSPDYNEYVTYTVTTDCEEVAIGDTLTYTIKIKNHSRYYFEAIFVNGSIENTRIDYDEYEDYKDLEHGLDPYETRVIEIEITVPEHVAWYKVGDEYYFNLKPELDYWVLEDQEINPGLYGWGYTNMIGVDPIPVRITNLNDGSDLISVECLDENNMIYFYDYNHRDEDESRTFFGQYDGYIYNYLKFKNLTNEEFNVISIENVTNIFWRNYVSYFGKNETEFVVYSEEEFNLDISSSYYIVPEEVPDEIKIHYNMTFASSEGKYYAIGVERNCETKIYELPEVNVIFSLQENGKVTARITNHSDYEVQDVVIYYKIYAPGTIEVLMENSIITTLQRGETVEIYDIEYEPKEEGSDEYISNLRIGMFDGNTFIYRYIQYDGEEIEEINLIEYSHDIWSMDVPASEVRGNILPLTDILNGNEEHVQATSTIEPTGSPQITASHQPTSTPEPSPSPCATATSVVTVTSDKRYYVNPWVYHSLAAAAAILVGLILLRRRNAKLKTENSEE